jgi:hypothetical protein
MMRKYIKTKTKLQTKSLLNELTGFVWFEQLQLLLAANDKIGNRNVVGKSLKAK